MLKHVPNILTIIRFIFIPFILLAIIHDEYLLAFILLTSSAITDILDGYIARKFDFITNFGKLIDPLADKSTQISILATLVFKGIIPVWILFVVFIKEFIMIAGASFLYGKELVVSSRWYGKLATICFYIAIVSSLAIRYFHLAFSFDQYIYYLSLLITFLSLIMYFQAFYKNGYLKKEDLKSEGKEIIPSNREKKRMSK